MKRDRFIAFCEKAVYAAAMAGWLIVVVAMAID